MGFRVNTNVASLNAHQVGAFTNREIGQSLQKLGSGLRIYKSADDASGQQIADTLKMQSSAFSQSIKNINDGIGILSIADKAMDEQVKMLDTIKVKATQSAQDGQTEDTRKALQQDITKLMTEIDNIASTTSFNGKSLLSGQYTNKKFQIGAYSNETMRINIQASSTDKIGNTRFETSKEITSSTNISLNFKDVNGLHDVKLEAITISTSAGTGLGVLTETINKNSEATGIKASFNVIQTASDVVKSGSIKGLSINGIQIGNIENIKANDSDGTLVNAINSQTQKHGIIASIDERGRLELQSLDGRGIKISAQGATQSNNVVGTQSTMDSILGLGNNSNSSEYYGRLTLTRLDSRDIIVSGTTLNANGSLKQQGVSSVGFGMINGKKIEAEAIINLRDIKNNFTLNQASAIGAFANANTSILESAKKGMYGNTTISGVGLGAGVTTLAGAIATMSIADTSIKDLDEIRKEMGTTTNRLVSALNSISVAMVNAKSSESQIRDLDFAEESAVFQRNNILVQAGNYAITQSNQQQQNVMKLLQ